LTMLRISSLKPLRAPATLGTRLLYSRHLNMIERKNLLRFDLDATAIPEETEKLINHSRQLQDKVAGLSPQDRNFKTVVQTLADEEAEFGTLENNLTFPGYVSTSKDVRDAASAAEQKISEFGIESGMRQDVYAALKDVKEKEYEKLDYDQKRLLDRMIRDYERNGLALEEENRNRVKELKNRLAKLCIDFTKNIAEDNTTLLFSDEELAGCPAEFIENLDKDESTGKRKVTLRYPDILPVMRFCKVAETRKALDRAKSSQCQDVNVPLFEEALKIRDELAHLLGFSTHADYILDIRMAKNSKNVFNFLYDLRDRLRAGGEQELKVLSDLKVKENDGGDPKIYSYDYNYYLRLLKETQYEVDESLIKNYFPFDKVFNGLLAIVQETFNLKFEEVKNFEKWHEDVRLFNVYDNDDNTFSGQFYLDLFPREGKYTHFAAFPLQCHYIKEDGTEQHAVSAMVCNFTKPTATAPSLLKHDEVVTLWHEFGHLAHGFTTKAKYGRFSGTSVERDFVEMPSQFMENYCWEKEALRRISSHYETGEPLPDTLIDKMIAAKNVGVALFNLRQLFFALFDMISHTTPPPIDSYKLYSELKEQISLIPNQEGTNGVGGFGHLMGGYDAGYYGYLYSQVFSADMFSEFKEKGIFSKEVGKKYRKTVLETGGMRDGLDILQSFLGRAPRSDAFLESIGLSK
jgi:thimet oligopeptidase